MIRLNVPSIAEEDLNAVRETLESGFLVQGARVAEFETLVAEQVGVQHAVAVANGTCALHLGLASLGVTTGDVCVVTAYSWIATANVVELCGARPVFVDIDSRTFNIDVQKLDDTLRGLMSQRETARSTKVVLPVHTFGQMADMNALSALCGRWDLPIVEDAACALGAAQDGRAAGSWGALGCFSFHPRKSVTTGEGGIVSTNDSAIASRIRALRNHGMDADSPVPDFIFPGYNFRLTEFQAALGVVQMAKLERIIDRRVKAAARYDQLLAGTGIIAPHTSAGATHVYQSYVVLLPEEYGPKRSAMIKGARDAGVELQVGTIHIPLSSYYRRRYGYAAGDFPVADSVAARALTLPLFEGISAEQQDIVVETVMASLS